MDDVILVLNSGSSSIKFSVFVEREDQIDLKFRGQIDGLYASPRFIAKDAAGNEMGARNWGEGVRLGHEGAIAYLNEIKPYLWRHGETYPSTPRELNRLFANNEVDFTMSYGPAFASILIAKGEFPPTARTFLFADVDGAPQTGDTHKIFEGPRDRHRELALAGIAAVAVVQRRSERRAAEGVEVRRVDRTDLRAFLKTEGLIEAEPVGRVRAGE
jgi:hypothetical protein